jgi:hypothetical protein
MRKELKYALLTQHLSNKECSHCPQFHNERLLLPTAFLWGSPWCLKKELTGFGDFHCLQRCDWPRRFLYFWFFVQQQNNGSVFRLELIVRLITLNIHRNIQPQAYISFLVKLGILIASDIRLIKLSKNEVEYQNSMVVSFIGTIDATHVWCRSGNETRNTLVCHCSSHLFPDFNHCCHHRVLWHYGD